MRLEKKREKHRTRRNGRVLVVVCLSNQPQVDAKNRLLVRGVRVPEAIFFLFRRGFTF